MPKTILNGNLVTSSSSYVEGNLIPSVDDTYSLGAPDRVWKDVYIGPGSLYLNGTKILDNSSDTINMRTDTNQALNIQTSGTGTLTMYSSGTGDLIIEGGGPLIINSTGNGALELNSGSGGIDFNTLNSGTINFNSDIVLEGRVNGDIKGDNLFLGDEDTTPKIDLFFKDSPTHPGIDIFKTRIELGKSDDFINSPAFPPNDAYGMNVQANSDALFVGIETYDSGSNWRPLLKWGDDSTDTPFTIQSYSGNHKWEFRTDGTLSAQSFAPTYSSIPNLIGKIGQAVDAANVPVTLVANAWVQVRSLTIPYTGVWLISMSLYLGSAGNLTTDIKYPTNIQVNGSTVQLFYGTNVTGVNGSVTLYLSVNDVVTFNTFLLTGSGMTAGQRNVWGTPYTVLKAIRIA